MPSTVPVGGKPGEPQNAGVMDAWQRELIGQCRVARLGTIAGDGRPRLVPVCYALVGDDIAIAIDEKPKRTTELARIRDVRRDPRVSLLLDHYDDDDWSQLAWARIDGEAEVVERGDHWPAALAALRQRYPQYSTMRLEERPMLRIHPTRATGWRAAHRP